MASISIRCPSCSATEGVVRNDLVYVKNRFGGFLLLEGQKDE
ncbi:IS1 family transposase [Escherichia coli]